MNKLKVDKKGNIHRPDGSVLGTPIKKGTVYRGTVRTGRIDLETGNVYNLKEEIIGVLNISVFGDLFNEQIAKLKSSKTKTNTKKSKSVVQETTPETTLETTPEPESTYNPGKDSSLILSGKLSEMLYSNNHYMNVEERILNAANKKYHWNHKSWDEISMRKDLTDKFLEEHINYIKWFIFLKNNPDRKFDDHYAKIFNKQLSLRNLGLVPCNVEKTEFIMDHKTEKRMKSPSKKTK